MTKKDKGNGRREGTKTVVMTDEERLLLGIGGDKPSAKERQREIKRGARKAEEALEGTDTPTGEPTPQSDQESPGTEESEPVDEEEPEESAELESVSDGEDLFGDLEASLAKFAARSDGEAEPDLGEEPSGEFEPESLEELSEQERVMRTATSPGFEPDDGLIEAAGGEPGKESSKKHTSVERPGVVDAEPRGEGTPAPEGDPGLKEESGVGLDLTKDPSSVEFVIRTLDDVELAVESDNIKALERAAADDSLKSGVRKMCNMSLKGLQSSAPEAEHDVGTEEPTVPEVRTPEPKPRKEVAGSAKDLMPPAPDRTPAPEPAEEPAHAPAAPAPGEEGTGRVEGRDHAAEVSGERAHEPAAESPPPMPAPAGPEAAVEPEEVDERKTEDLTIVRKSLQAKLVGENREDSLKAFHALRDFGAFDRIKISQDTLAKMAGFENAEAYNNAVTGKDKKVAEEAWLKVYDVRSEYKETLRERKRKFEEALRIYDESEASSLFLTLRDNPYGFEMPKVTDDLAVAAGYESEFDVGSYLNGGDDAEALKAFRALRAGMRKMSEEKPEGERTPTGVREPSEVTTVSKLMTDADVLMQNMNAMDEDAYFELLERTVHKLSERHDSSEDDEERKETAKTLRELEDFYLKKLVKTVGKDKVGAFCSYAGYPSHELSTAEQILLKARALNEVLSNHKRGARLLEFTPLVYGIRKGKTPSVRARYCKSLGSYLTRVRVTGKDYEKIDQILSDRLVGEKDVETSQNVQFEILKVLGIMGDEKTLKRLDAFKKNLEGRQGNGEREKMIDATEEAMVTIAENLFKDDNAFNNTMALKEKKASGFKNTMRVSYLVSAVTLATGIATLNPIAAGAGAVPLALSLWAGRREGKSVEATRKMLLMERVDRLLEANAEAEGKR